MEKSRRHHKKIMTPEIFVLKKVRMDRKISARKVALDIGMNPSYLQNMELGRHNLSENMLAKLLTYYGLSKSKFKQMAQREGGKAKSFGEREELKRIIGMVPDNKVGLVKEIVEKFIGN